MRDRRWCLGSADPAALDRPAKQQAIDHGAVGRAPFGTAGGHGGVGPGRRRRRRVRAALGRRPDRQTVTGRPELAPEPRSLEDLAAFDEPGWLEFGMELVLESLGGDRTV